MHSVIHSIDLSHQVYSLTHHNLGVLEADHVFREHRRILCRGTSNTTKLYNRPLLAFILLGNVIHSLCPTL